MYIVIVISTDNTIIAETPSLRGCGAQTGRVVCNSDEQRTVPHLLAAVGSGRAAQRAPIRRGRIDSRGSAKGPSARDLRRPLVLR